MKTYFRIVNPEPSCAGPKAGVGYVLSYMRVLEMRKARGFKGKDASVEIAGWGMWVLNEDEYEHISAKEYFVTAMKNTIDVFRNYE
ncbi:MAG: hypothetical protein ACTSPB_12205 [Candidatus Thorarchaeota archaeon]